MSNILSKVPFFRLFLFLLVGILCQYYFDVAAWSAVVGFMGLGFIFFSLLLHPSKQHQWRWLFGVGLAFFLFAVGAISTANRQEQSTFSFADEAISYKGIVTEIPLVKPKSIACKVYLDNLGKNVVCYLQKGVRSKQLKVGDEIMFHGKIEHFKNFGNPDEFDYPKYMYNKGFSGSIYLYSDDWEATGESPFSLMSMAQTCRKQVLDFYQTLGLDETEYSLLSALTLGYKDALSDDVQQAFRTTGTAHVLAVSGLHVGVIYGAILSFFSLFYRNTRNKKHIQVFVLVSLWVYAFVTGLPPSVVRASIMLSLFCVSNILSRRGLTFNNIFMAAFVMLVYNPFSFFDLGFQLSFGAVLSICFFQPYLAKLLVVKNKYLRWVWNLFTLSLAAQIGTFPLCFYYFGTFPTYFFVTNLLIVPLVTLIIYAAIVLSFIALLSRLFSTQIAEVICFLPSHLTKILIAVMVDVIHFFEALPFALIENLHISLATLLFLLAIIASGTLFLIRKTAKPLICSLCFVLAAFAVHLLNSFIFTTNALTIYQRNNKTEISWNVKQEKFVIDSLADYQLIKIGDKVLLSTSVDRWKNTKAEKPFKLDYLHILNNDSVSLYSLTQTFSVPIVILDCSLSAKRRKRLSKECNKLGIPCYDASENGFVRINF